MVASRWPDNPLALLRPNRARHAPLNPSPLQVTLPHVLSHLRSRSPALVSGCAKESRAGLYDRFMQVGSLP